MLIFKSKESIGILFGIFASFSQANSDKKTLNSPPFKQGEWFQLRIHYGIFNASYATLSLERDTLKGRPVFHAKAYGETTGIANWFFKVEDYYESYFDEITNLPYKFIRDINEGGYTKKIEIDFLGQQIYQYCSRVYQKMRNSNIWGGMFSKKS